MSASILIVCEGDSDEAFFRELIRVRGLSKCRVYVRERTKDGSGFYGGKDAFEIHLRSIKTGSKYPDIKLVVVVADCDDDLDKSFSNVADQIRAAEDYGVPNKPLEVAAPVTTAPSVVVLLLPWGMKAGAVEKMWLVAAKHKRSRLFRLTKKFADSVDSSAWSEANLDKLQFRCLLSASVPTEPNIGPQYAWETTRGRPGDIVPVDHKCFNAVVNWLGSL